MWLYRLARQVGNVRQICRQNDGHFCMPATSAWGQYLLRSQQASGRADGSASGLPGPLTEIHHTEKKDAPSGTPFPGWSDPGKNSPENRWVNHISDNLDELEIISERLIRSGTHKIEYSSSIDTIEIIHTAHSRVDLLRVRYWRGILLDKKGTFQMSDVLGF